MCDTTIIINQLLDNRCTRINYPVMNVLLQETPRKCPLRAMAEDDVDASVDVPITPNTLSPAEMDIIITNARILVLK